MIVKKKGGQPPYYQAIKTTLKYIALVSQTSTNAPVATVLLDDFKQVGKTVAITRNSTGNYRITWGGFSDTINDITVQGTAATTIVSAGDTGGGQLYVNTYNTVTALNADGQLLGARIEITARQVYI